MTFISILVSKAKARIKIGNLQTNRNVGLNFDVMSSLHYYVGFRVFLKNVKNNPSQDNTIVIDE